MRKYGQSFAAQGDNGLLVHFELRLSFALHDKKNNTWKAGDAAELSAAKESSSVAATASAAVQIEKQLFGLHNAAVATAIAARGSCKLKQRCYRQKWEQR